MDGLPGTERTPRSLPGCLLALALLVCSLGLAPSAPALDGLPAFTGEWVNCEPIDANDLKGKMAVILFFDEAAPQYKTLWADLVKVRTTHELTDHVMFIAVNSGSPKALVMAYAMTYKAAYHVMADEDRSYEKQFGIHVDKSNYEVAYFLEPSGNLKLLDNADMEKSVKAEIEANQKSVKYRLDTTDMPGQATPLSTAIEFGVWKSACGTVVNDLRSRDAKMRDFAAKANDVIKEVIEQKTAAAKAQEEGGDKYGAFKAYKQIAASFPGRSEARAAYDAAAKLMQLQTIQREIQAREALDQTENNTRDILKQPGAKAWYEAVVKNYPNTQASVIAQALINDAEDSAGVPRTTVPPAGTPGVTATATTATTTSAGGLKAAPANDAREH